MEIIDAHCYLGEGRHLQQDVDGLLAAMDRAEISHALVSPVDVYMAVRNHEGNDLVLKASGDHADRLSAIACVNPWFANDARRPAAPLTRGPKQLSSSRYTRAFD